MKFLNLQKPKILLILITCFISCQTPEPVIETSDYLDSVDTTQIVKVEGGRSKGTGLVVKLNDVHYILTANHVIQQGNSFLGIVVDNEYLTADLVASKDEFDVALLKPHHDISHLTPIKLASEVRLNSRIYKMGHPLSLGLVINEGIINHTIFRAEMNGVTREDFLFSADTTLGDSGGGVFYQETGECVGMIISVYNSPFGPVSEHLAIMVSATTIQSWLDSLSPLLN